MTPRRPKLRSRWALGAALTIAGLACQGGPARRSPTLGTGAGGQPAASNHAPPATAAEPVAQVAPGASEPPLPAQWPPEPPRGVTSDFCIEQVDVLDEETCYVLPDAPTDELLLYLHGIVPPTKTSAQKTNFETVVANAARRAGVAALMPRGRRGLAPKGYDGWWGWPTSGELYARLADELVASFAEKRRKLEALTGARFSRWYVAGSSSGAYFAAALAVNGGIDADAFGALSGGASTARARPEALSAKPFYIGYGSFDTVGASAQALGAQLRRAGWPVKIAIHPVGHGAKEVYLDEAFAFFRETAAQRTGTRVVQPTE